MINPSFDWFKHLVNNKQFLDNVKQLSNFIGIFDRTFQWDWPFVVWKNIFGERYDTSEIFLNNCLVKAITSNSISLAY